MMRYSIVKLGLVYMYRIKKLDDTKMLLMEDRSLYNRVILRKMYEVEHKKCLKIKVDKIT